MSKMGNNYIKPTEESYRANLFWQINDPTLPDDTPTKELERILNEIFLEAVKEQVSVDTRSF